MAACLSSYIDHDTESKKFKVVMSFHDHFEAPVAKYLYCVFDHLEQAEEFKEMVTECVRLFARNYDYRLATGLSLASTLSHKLKRDGYDIL